GQAEGHLGWAAYYRAAGDPVRAHQHATQARSLATAPRQPVALLAAHRLLGELETDAHRFADAQTQLAASLTLAEMCQAPYERALTLFAMVALQMANGQSLEARTLLDEVRALCIPLGARPTLGRATALEARLADLHELPSAYPAGL